MLVQREQSGGGSTHPRGSACAGCDFPQPPLLPPIYQDVCDVTGGGWHSDLGESKDFWDDGLKMD